jgi:hypothetical protein
MEKAIKSVKDAFESGNVIITNIMQGYGQRVRVDAKTRFHKPDMDNRLSEWVSEKYANKLAMENYGKKVNELSVYRY